MPVDYEWMRQRVAKLGDLRSRELERLELHVRRAASRQRLLLQRGPGFDPHAPAHTWYRLVNARNGEAVAGGEGGGYSLTLGEVIELLHGRDTRA